MCWVRWPCAGGADGRRVPAGGVPIGPPCSWRPTQRFLRSWGPAKRRLRDYTACWMTFRLGRTSMHHASCIMHHAPYTMHHLDLSPNPSRMGIKCMPQVVWGRASCATIQSSTPSVHVDDACGVVVHVRIWQHAKTSSRLKRRRRFAGRGHVCVPSCMPSVILACL